MADHHVQVDNEKVYKCGHCGMTSQSIEELKFHMLSTHLNEAAGNMAAPEVIDDTGAQEEVTVNLPIDSEGKYKQQFLRK